MANGLVGLKIELRELRGELADNLVMQQRLTQSVETYSEALSQATDPTEIERLTTALNNVNTQLEEQVAQQINIAEAAGRVADTMADVNEQVAIFAGGSGFEQAGNALGGFTSKLANLDFGGAQEDAARFKSIMQGLNKAEVLDGFKNMMKGISDVGKGFASVGKTLLTNPIFLIPVIIAGIVTAIVLLKDKIKIVGDAFDMMMIPINALIDGLKELSDWLGLTSFQADENAAKAQENANKQIAANESKTKNAINNIDQEIKIANIQGENTKQLEIEKQRIIKDSAIANAKSLQASIDAAKSKSVVDKEELKDLREKLKIQKELIGESINEIKVIKAQDEADRQKEIEKNNTDAEAKAKVQRDKNIAIQKEYAKQRLDTSRQLKDLEIANMEDGIEKELETNKTKYDRLIQDTLKNEKLLQSEKDNLINQFNIQRSSTNEKLITDNAKKEAELTAKMELDKQTLEQEQYQLLQESTLSKQELEFFNLALDYEKKFELAKGNAKLETALQDKMNSDISELNAKYRADEEAKDKESAEKHKVLQQQKFDAVRSVFTTIGNLAEVFAGKSKKQQETAFKVQKAANIAGATMDTYKAATGAYASLAGIPTVGPVLGAVAAAAAVAAGLVNIKNISNQKFDSGTPPSPAPPAPTPNLNLGGSNERTESATPSFNLFGNKNNFNNVGSTTSAQANTNQNIIVTAVVSESDITSTQNKVAKYQNSAEL